jgi:glucose-6-phosphate 1-dehydrogenase
MERFVSRLFYLSVDATAHDADWSRFRDILDPDRVRVFYLATSPDLYGPTCKALGVNGLVTDRSRVVLEKPIGHDAESAHAIIEEVGKVFTEAQTFRIDHYLGKETVQNLMALRFANTIFERLWTADVIDHVQITVAETVGLEGRGGYYDKSGALRDMLQNHMLQLLCLIAMDPPVSLEADRVRDEKLKVLRALKPLEPHEVANLTVRGQYTHGAIDGKPVPSYLADLGSDDPSSTESFVALKAEVRTWRWSGVPFYLRTGKRLPAKVSEIVIQFRKPPFSIFPPDVAEWRSNTLIIRLQPEEGMRLEMMTKDPGPGGLRLSPTGLDISFEKTFGKRFPDAYERLLMDTVRGNPTLFMRRDEVEAAWAWVEPILEAWAARPDHPRPYPAGSWGPTAAIALIERDGRTWHEEVE